jgi:hypothetical protein
MAVTPNTKKGSHRGGMFSTAQRNDTPQVTTPKKPKFGAILGWLLGAKKVDTPRQ